MKKQKSPASTYMSARITLILVAVLGAITLASYVTSDDGTFLILLLGSIAPVFITEIFFAIAGGLGIPAVFYAGVAVDAVVLLLYVALFFLSANRKGFMLVAAILYALDTLVFLLYFDIIGIVFHVLVLIELFYAFFKGMTKEEAEYENARIAAEIAAKMQQQQQ